MKTGVRALRSLVKGMTSHARYDLSGNLEVLRVEVGPESLEDPSKYHVKFRSGTRLAEAV